jgi:hypothetical protein
MISLPNFLTEDKMTQEQHDKLLDKFIQILIGGMDIDELIEIASNKIESDLKEKCSTPDELIEEIKFAFGDDDAANKLINQVIKK